MADSPEGGPDVAPFHQPENPPELEAAPDAENGNGHVPPSMFESLQEQYAAATDERRKTIQIAPGRFRGSLAVRCKPGPWSDYRKRAQRMQSKGGGEEAELSFASQTIVQCTETILYRPADDAGLIPMHEAYSAWKDQGPVRFDRRLAEAIGIPNPPDSAVAICRLVFKPAALNDFFVTLDAWLREAIPSDGEDSDEEDGRIPPT